MDVTLASGIPASSAICGSSDDAPAVILVTGGTGLVGRALAEVIQSCPEPKESWVFLSSKDGDLW